MRVFLVLAVSIFCFIFPITASAAIKPPTVLTRVGKWEVNYDQDSCHLFRKFGVGADELTVNFTRYTLGDSFDLSLYGNPSKVRRA